MSAGSREGIARTREFLRQLTRTTLKAFVPFGAMTVPVIFLMWLYTEAVTVVGVVLTAVAGLSFYVIGDRLRDEPEATTDVDYDEIPDNWRRLVIFMNVYYLNVVTAFGAITGIAAGNVYLGAAGFVAFFYPAVDHWLGRQRWWLSPAMIVAGLPVYLPYGISLVRSHVAGALSLEGDLRERGENLVKYLDPEGFNFELLDVENLGQLQ